MLLTIVAAVVAALSPRLIRALGGRVFGLAVLGAAAILGLAALISFGGKAEPAAAPARLADQTKSLSNP